MPAAYQCFLIRLPYPGKTPGPAAFRQSVRQRRDPNPYRQTSDPEAESEVPGQYFHSDGHPPELMYRHLEQIL